MSQIELHARRNLKTLSKQTRLEVKELENESTEWLFKKEKYTKMLGL